jgi:hypothetical protein
LQNDMNAMKEQGMKYISDLYTKTYQKPTNLSNIKSKNIDVSNVLRADTFNDDIDVSTTGGDDTFQNLKTDQTESFIPLSPLKTKFDTYDNLEDKDVTIINEDSPISYELYQKELKENEIIQKQIAINEIKKETIESNFEKKVKIYTDLCLKNDKIPKQTVIDSKNPGTINAAIKSIDPVFYNSNIKRKSNKKSK